MYRLAIIATLLFSHVASFAGKRSVQQEIRYSSGEAAEVYCVWGIDNWQKPERRHWPAGTFQKEGLSYTPMFKKGEHFSVVFQLPEGTTLDYVFWITKGLRGKPSDIWDTNTGGQKDYHQVALQDNITLIESTLKATPEEPLTLLDFAPGLFISALIILLLIVVLKKNNPVRMQFRSPVLLMCFSSMMLWVLLMVSRTSITGISWDLYRNPLPLIPEVLISGYYDLVFVLVILLFFTALIWLFGKRKAAQRIVLGSFFILSLVTLITGILNIRITGLLGHPFNYQWLYYADFLKGTDAKSAISSQVDTQYILRIIAVCLFAVLISILLFQLALIVQLRRRLKLILSSAALLLLCAYLAAGESYFSNGKKETDRYANAVFSFMSSMDLFSDDPILFTMKIPDSLRCCLSPPAEQAKIKRTAIRNVLMFVLESTPAEYLDVYGSRYQATPGLQKYLQNAVIFEQIYAHAPSTNNSMVSMLGSVYPWLSYQSITREHPAIEIPTLSAELKAKGYRTAFFNSADNRFQKAGEFLSYREFDHISDCNSMTCDDRFEVKDDKHDFLNGGADECTAREMLRWINEGNSQPFFTMMWTYQTHYPYFFKGEEKVYDAHDSIFNRYLNAVSNSDRILGLVLAELERTGKADSTLVVVVGDHGEAFGRHGQTTHASGIYEENLHVPCIFIHPSFAMERKNTIGGLVDLAPTIAALLGYPPSTEWQGSSLFSGSRTNRTYFFSPWSDHLFGCREGSMKYIFNASKNRREIYDLEKDPYETMNLAGEDARSSEYYHMRLAGWVQALNEFMERKLDRKKSGK